MNEEIKLRFEEAVEFDRNARALGLNYYSGVKLVFLLAVREDLYDVLRKLAENAKYDIQLGWIEGENCLEDMQDRIAKSLEYIVGDAEFAQDFPKSGVSSYDYGLDCVFELASKLIIAADSEIFLNINNPESRILINKIQACQMALIATGHVQQAFDIARLAGALKCFNDESDPFQRGKDRASYKYLQQLKILRIVISAALNELSLPPKKYVRLKMQESPMQESQFSRYMRELRINQILTKDPWDLAPKETKGVSTDFEVPKSKNPAISMSEAMQNLKSSNVENVGRVVAEKDLGLKPSGKSSLVDSDVRKIKDAMGQLYWFLLIQFGMGEIATKSELDMFEQKLSELGLSLK